MRVAEGVKVASFIPGRVRIKVDELKGAEALAKRVEAELAEVPGIKTVEANGLSGSVLVKYDRKTIRSPSSAQQLGAALARLFPNRDLSRLTEWLSGN